MISSTPALKPFVCQKTVLLTTRRRDATPLGTSVNIVVDGAHAFVRASDTAWKLKRVHNNPKVKVAPSTARDKPTGPAIRAGARVLSNVESAYA